MNVISSPAPPILRSWERCRARGLLPDAAPRPIGGALSEAQQQLLALARSSIEDLYQLIERPGFAVLLADAQARAIDLEGDAAVLGLAAALGLSPPADMSEECAGTNAVDLALREAQPFQTEGANHYSRGLRGLALAAAPIFDPAGTPLGALAILTAAGATHPHTLGLAIAAAQSLHNQLRAERLLGEANDQLAELYATLETMSEGLIFIGPRGDIRRINTRAADMLGVSRHRVAGQPVGAALAPPGLVQSALYQHEELAEQEFSWLLRQGTLSTLCGVRPVWDRGRRYLGALITLRPTQSVHQLVQRVVGARAQFTFSDIIGKSHELQLALHQAHMAAGASGPLLLMGAPGVGKKLFAQAIHNASARAGGPFVGVNCAAVPRPLLGSELFGIEGDPEREGQPGRPGKIELAQSGVLYLEALDALPIDLQTALLRAIEMGRILRMGGTRPRPIDVRVIATGHDLERLAQEGRLRADLYARLSALTVDIPPLRRRGDDLLLLVGHMLLLLGERLGRPVVLDPEALHALRAYPWPGNVRELELTLERALQNGEKNVLTLDDLPPAIARLATPLDLREAPRLAQSYDLTEREAIVRAGRLTAGHLGRTAATLGISRATLWRKMTRHGISKADFWEAPER